MTAGAWDDSVRFVLVEPQAAGNVGAAARALKNLGFHRLVVVAPDCDPRGPEAARMAVDAADVLARAEVVADLDAALAGAATVVGTTGRTGKQRLPHYRLDELAPRLVTLGTSGELAVLFGREKRGLTAVELDRCTHLVHFLASEDYPSFNLAQSVLLVAYELRRSAASLSSGSASASLTSAQEEGLADDAQREAMYAHLQDALLALGFLKQDTTEGRMRRLRRMLGRATLSPGDADVLRGIARQILWLAGVARR